MTFITNLLIKTFDADFLFTDTDSLSYEVKSIDVYEEFKKKKHLLDLSNFPKDLKFFDSANEMVLGKMRDELKSISINEFIGLKSKMYFIVSENGEEVNSAKGVYIYQLS